jgi:hypothetical protein
MTPIDDDDDGFGGGDTKAHYLPIEPREPAPPSPPCRARGCQAPLNRYGTCSVHFRESLRLNEATPVPLPPAPSEAYAVMEVDLPVDAQVDGAAPIAESQTIPLKRMPREPGAVFRDPPQISSPDLPRSRSIAEAFQDMLRQAFEAGGAAARSGETFETWYQREVLR